MDRSRNASKNRKMQVKRWTQYDKAIEKEESSRLKKGLPLCRKGPKTVRFSQNLVLLEAGNQGDTEEVKRLLKEGLCVDVANSDGLTALHQAAINNHVELCRLLLNYSANVNVKDRELWTPFHAAAHCGHREVCLLLIRSGAELMALNNEENMPYDICEDEATLDAIESEMAARGVTQEMINEARLVPERAMLHDLQAAVAKQGGAPALHAFSQLDRQGANCLHVAAACGYVDVTRFLAALGAPLDAPDRDGWQAIHVAALYNQLAVIEVLVAKGADIDALTRQGETVFELVYGKEMSDKLLLLKKEAEKLRDDQSLAAPIGVVRKCSTTNPRSTSIRRTSTKEKSNLSWMEARQEARLRLAAESSDGHGQGDGSLPATSRLEPVREAAPPVGVRWRLRPAGDDKDSPRARSLSGESEGGFRGSFTHAHPYHSPTRDPETFQYRPAPAVATHPARPSLEAPKPRPTDSHSSPHENPKQPIKPASGIMSPVTASKRPSTAPLPGTQGHTSRIASARASSQGTAPRDRATMPPKQPRNRYRKPSKPNSCCHVM